MSARKPTLLRVLGEIVFITAMFVGILGGVHEGLALAIPANSCARTPVAPGVYVLSLAFFIHLASPKCNAGLSAWIRLGATLLAGAVVVTLVARLGAGCTPAAEWNAGGRIIIEASLMNAILVPLAHLHRRYIEPRWVRATGQPDHKREDVHD